MPSVAEEPSCYGGGRASTHHGLTITTSKKRRWDDGRSSCDTGNHNHNGMGLDHGLGDSAVVSVFIDGDDVLSHKLAATTPIRSIPCSATQRKIIPLASKRRRLSNCENPATASPTTTTSTTTTPHVSPLMLPCHVCQRKPRRKSDLDSQADCEGCGQRTCFVCLRECSAWPTANDIDDYEGQTPTDETSGHALCPLGAGTTKKQPSRPWSASSRGHRRIVCSRCCVERGGDGEVVCLGCMSC